MAEDSKGIIARALAEQAKPSAGQEAQAQYANIAKLVASILNEFPAPIEGQWYLNQTITLDGFRFNRCRFDGCRITVTRGNFLIDSCFFSNCTFFFPGEAQKVLRAYWVNSPDQWALIPQFAPVRNPDGTITIA